MRYDTRNRTSLSLRPNQSTTSMRPVLGRGEKGQDGSNVLPTDEAIANAIDTPGSDTSTSLKASYAPTVRTVRDVALGDSQTAGTLTPGMNYPTVLQTCLRRSVVIRNAGVGGNTTDQMLARFDTDVAPYAPARVLFMAGTNDIAGSVPLATTKSNIAAIYAKTVAIGAEFITATIPPRNQHSGPSVQLVRDLNTWIKIWAAANGIRCVDVHSVLVVPRTDVYQAALNVDSPNVHPTPAGVLAIAQKWASDLERPFRAASLLPDGCEYDFPSSPTGARLVRNPFFYGSSTLVDGVNYPSNPGYWDSNAFAAVAVASASADSTVKVSEALATGSYVFTYGNVQAETRTVDTVTDNGDGTWTVHVTSPFSNPHPVATVVTRADALATISTGDSRFRDTRCLKVVASNQASPAYYDYPLSGWSVGDKLRLVGRFTLESVTTAIPQGKGVGLQLVFSGGTTADAAVQWNLANPIGDSWTPTVDAAVPAGTTSVKVRCSVDLGSGAGTVQFAEVDAINLTTLGVDSIAVGA